MAASLPTIIVLALGAATLGGPDALRALVEFKGQSPCLDIAICMFLMFMVTTYLLGAVLLVRFVRGNAAGGAQGGHGAAATDFLAKASLLVSVCVGFLVAVCLVTLPSGGLGTVTFFTCFNGKNFFAAVAVIATAVRCTSRRLLSFVPAAGNAGDDGPAAERFSWRMQTLWFIFIALLLAAASGGLDAWRLFAGFPCRCRTPTTYVPVGVAIVTVAGTALAVRFSRRVRIPVTGRSDCRFA